MHKRSRTGLYIRLAAALAAAASLIPVCALDDVRGAPTNSVSAYEKFDVILKRSPFGPPPPVVLSAKEIAAAALAQAPVEQEKVTPLTAVVRLNAITRYDGLPAAGFVDKESNASYFLVEGQTIEDYTLDEVSLAKSSIILTKGGQTEEIFLSFASGQPTNIVPIAGTKFLTALDFRKRGEEAPQEVAAEEAAPEVTEVEAAAAPVEGEPRLSPEIVEAATITKDGEQRLSFRELHRLRIQEQRRKQELEKQQEEEKLRKDKELAEAREKQEKLAQATLNAAIDAAETQCRSRMIEAIKEGQEVDEGFELTVQEAKALADAGFAIPEELLANGNGTGTTETSVEPTPESSEPTPEATPEQKL